MLLLCAALPGIGQEKAKLRGVVRDPPGNAIATAIVTLTSEDAKTFSIDHVDATGLYAFGDVVAGRYTLTVTAPGFDTQSKPMVFLPGEIVSLNVKLMLTEGALPVPDPPDPLNLIKEEPTATIFGLPQKQVEIPRSITNIDKATIDVYSLQTVDDLVALAPGSYAGTYFGIPGSVFLRGEPSDNFFRGFRRAANFGNYPTPLDASDHIEVVAGPPSLPYPGGKMGGFVNFYPKSVRSENGEWLDKGHGSVMGRVGQYNDKTGSVEYGLPFNIGFHRAGVYVLYEAKRSGSFYNGAFDKSQLGLLTTDLQLSRSWRLAVGFQGYDDQGIPIGGWNRVTQELIDHQMYQAGSPLINLSSNGADIGMKDIAPGTLNQTAYQQNMGAVFNVKNYGSIVNDFALDPSTMHMVKLSLNQVLIDPQDFLRTQTYTAYGDLVDEEVLPGLSIKNQSFWDRMFSEKYSSYGFGARYSTYNLENRSTVTIREHPNQAVRMNAYGGLDLDFQTTPASEEREDYEALDRRDISVGATPNDRFQGPFGKTPVPFQYLNLQNYKDYGMFLLTNFDISNKLSLTLGVHLSRFADFSSGRASGYGDTILFARATYDGWFNGGISYRLPWNLTPYFSIVHSRHIDFRQGNEIPNAEATSTGQSFIEPSSLYEAGIKTDVANRFYGTVAVYRQKRTQWNPYNFNTDFLNAKGAEMELRASFRRLSFSGTLTWQEPKVLNAPFLLAIPPSLIGLTGQQAYGGKFEGLASNIGPPHPGAYAVAGQAHWIASPFATVNVTKNIGYLVGMTWVSAVHAGYVSPVVLPSHAVWRGSMFYRRKHYDFNLNVNNMFNQIYFESQYLYEDSLVKPGVLRTVGGTVRIHF